MHRKCTHAQLHFTCKHILSFESEGMYIGCPRNQRDDGTDGFYNEKEVEQKYFVYFENSS